MLDGVVVELVLPPPDPAVPTPSVLVAVEIDEEVVGPAAPAEFVDVAEVEVCEADATPNVLVLETLDTLALDDEIGAMEDGLTVLDEFLLEWPTVPPTAPPTIAPTMSKAMSAMVSLPLPDRQNETGAPPAR